MSKVELDRQIGTLLATLANTTSVDDETRGLLIAVQQESVRLTAVAITTKDRSAKKVALADNESIAERLEELAVRFEADHPAIGTAIRQTIDTLVKAGI